MRSVHVPNILKLPANSTSEPHSDLTGSLDVERLGCAL